MYPFTMYGRVVEIHRFAVAYVESIPSAPGMATDREFSDRIEYCHTQEQATAVAEHTGGTITELNSSTYEWLDGIEVADVPDTYAEAVRIYEMGREAYEAELAKPTPEETIAALENQVTDLQLALCDFYESVVV